MNTALARKASAAVLVVVFATQANSTPEHLTPEKIREIEVFIGERMAEIGVPGLAVALLEKGEVVYSSGFGAADLAGRPVTTSTPFRVGSVTKSFTALATVLFAEEGLLDLDDFVADHIPWFRTKDEAMSSRITIRHLLGHRSGLSTVTGNRNHASTDISSDALETAVRELAEVELKYAPGEHFEYSNANYQILGLILEEKGGVPYEATIEQRIFEPLDMANSAVLSAERATMARGHHFWFGRVDQVDRLPSRTSVAQGGVYTSIDDLAAYVAELMRDEPEISTREAVIELFTPADADASFSYALGWYVAHLPEGKVIFHTGFSQGFEAFVGIAPERAIGFAVLANANSGFGHSNVTGLLEGVGNLALGREVPPKAGPLFKRGILAVVVALPLLIVLAAAMSIVRLRAGRARPLARPLNGLQLTLRLFLPSLALAGVAYALLVLLPGMNGGDLATGWHFYPDVTLLAVMGAVLALAWGLFRIWALFRVD